MAKKQSKPKMGRPPLPPGKRRGASMGFRPTPGIRGKLEEAAKANGRSMSQEVEHRLERSFEGDEALGGRQLRALFSLFGNAAVLIEEQTGKSCFKDWNTWVATLAAWKRLSVSFGPLSPKGWRKALLEASKATTGGLWEPPPEDAEPGVRAAYLKKAAKGIQAISAFYRYQENDRAQEVIGEEIAAALLPETPKKES